MSVGSGVSDLRSYGVRTGYDDASLRGHCDYLMLMLMVALILVTARRLFELRFRYVQTQRMNCAEVSRSPLSAMHDVGWGNPEFGVERWLKDDGLWSRVDASTVVD